MLRTVLRLIEQLYSEGLTLLYGELNILNYSHNILIHGF